jgi:hypothetical protein
MMYARKPDTPDELDKTISEVIKRKGSFSRNIGDARSLIPLLEKAGYNVDVAMASQMGGSSYRVFITNRNTKQVVVEGWTDQSEAYAISISFFQMLQAAEALAGLNRAIKLWQSRL